MTTDTTDRQASLPNSTVLNVGALPGRKLPCLYTQGGGRIEILASFKSKQAMHDFLSFTPKFNPKEAIHGR